MINYIIVLVNHNVSTKISLTQILYILDNYFQDDNESRRRTKGIFLRARIGCYITQHRGLYLFESTQPARKSKRWRILYPIDTNSVSKMAT